VAALASLPHEDWNNALSGIDWNWNSKQPHFRAIFAARARQQAVRALFVPAMQHLPSGCY